MGNLKVTIIGTSVAMRVRPPERCPDNKNYTQQLEEILQKKIRDKTVIIQNKSRGALNICDITSSTDEYINSFPHYSAEGYEYIAERLASIIVDDQK